MYKLLKEDDGTDEYDTESKIDKYDTSSDDFPFDNDSGYESCNTDSGYESSNNDDDNYDDESDVDVDSITSAIVAVTTTKAYNFDHMGNVSPDESSKVEVYVSSDESLEEDREELSEYNNSGYKSDSNGNSGVWSKSARTVLMKYRVVLNYMTVMESIMAVVGTIHNYVIAMIVAVIVVQKIYTMKIDTMKPNVSTN